MSDLQDVTKHYKFSSRFEKVGEKNIWVEINDLSRDYQAVDMAEGFANYISYEPLSKNVKEISQENDWRNYQYTRNEGHLRLVKAIAKYYEKEFDRDINPLDQVLITVGAYGSLHNAFSSLIEQNDEVILIEPFFDCFEPMVKIAGGKCVYVPLTYHSCEKDQTTVTTAAEWILNEKDLRAAFSSKTKLIVLNTPNNPLGKVYTREELRLIAELCIKHNVICISDEVYEHISFDKPHIRIASMPGMWERTLTIGSGGKVFSSTGIKVGWTLGPKELVKLCAVSHNNNINVCPTFFQEALARCYETELKRLEEPECYFNSLKTELKAKRDYLAEQLVEAGFDPIIPDGGFFMLANISQVAHDHLFGTDSKEYKDHKFVKFLIKEKNLALIPCTAFYGEDNKKLGQNLVRFCFFKDDETLKKAAHILKNLKYEVK